MYCSKCGALLPDDSVFCSECGNKISLSGTMRDDNKTNLNVDNSSKISNAGNDILGEQGNIINRDIDKKRKVDSGASAWFFLGLVCPFIGWILYLFWKKTNPLRSKQLLKGSNLGVIMYLMIWLLSRCSSYGISRLFGNSTSEKERNILYEDPVGQGVTDDDLYNEALQKTDEMSEISDIDVDENKPSLLNDNNEKINKDSSAKLNSDEDEKNNVVTRYEDYIASWHDTYSERCTMVISDYNGECIIEARWGNSARSSTYWSLLANYDDTTGRLNYTGVEFTDDEGKITDNHLESGYLYIDPSDERMHWSYDDECLFEISGEPYDDNTIFYQVAAPDYYVNLREGPSTDDSIIMEIPNGVLLAGGMNYDWCAGWNEIAFAGMTGYVASSQISSDLYLYGEKPESNADSEVNNGGADYICESSNYAYLTDQDLYYIRNSTFDTMPAGKTLEQMIINEMYARHGYKFKNQDIQKYFDKKDWYKSIGKYSNDMDDIYQQMNDFERKNIEYLQNQ